MGGLTTSHVTKCYRGLRLEQILQNDLSNEKMDMKYGTWNIMNLYKSGCLKKVSREVDLRFS
jgi:hypothetical protein